MCLILTHDTPAAFKNTSSRCDGTNQRRWFSPQTWGSGIACCSSCSWWSEKGSIEQKVSFRSPIPTFPYGWPRVHSLCHLSTLKFQVLSIKFITMINKLPQLTMLQVSYLFSKRVQRSEVSVTLAVNCGISTASNCIHYPVGIVIVNHVEIPMSAPALSIIHPLLTQDTESIIII